MLTESELKKKLEKSAEEYKNRLEEDITNSVKEIQNKLKTTLLVGGSLVVAYSLYKMLIPDEKNAKSKGVPSESRFDPGIGDALISAGSEMMVLFLLSYTKKRLKEYIGNLSTMTEKMVKSNE